MTATTVLLAIGTSVLVLHVVFITTTLIAAQLLGVGVREISIFAGPTIISKRFGKMLVTLRPVPITAGVSFLRDSDLAALPPDETSLRTHDQLSPLETILLALAGPLAQLLLAFVLAGSIAAHQAGTALPEIYLGALQPATTGVHYLTRYTSLWERSPKIAIGILAAKQAALCMVPGIGLPGLVIVLALLEWLFHVRPSKPYDLNLVAAIPLLAPTFIPLIGWSIALIRLLATI